MWDADRIHQNVICSHATVFANKACQRGALSILMKTMLQIWWPDSNNNMKARQQGVLKDVALCLRSVRVWFDKRSGGWCREREREKGSGKEREGERELIEMACAWLTGASEGQSPCEATATRAIIPPRCIWISAMERSICLARGDTPPRLTAEDSGRDTGRGRGREGEWLKLENKLR